MPHGDASDRVEPMHPGRIDEVTLDAPLVDDDPTDPPATPFTFVPLYDTYCLLNGHAGYGVRDPPRSVVDGKDQA